VVVSDRSTLTVECQWSYPLQVLMALVPSLLMAFGFHTEATVWLEFGQLVEFCFLVGHDSNTVEVLLPHPENHRQRLRPIGRQLIPSKTPSKESIDKRQIQLKDGPRYNSIH
jgi:hypothetical protein